MENTSSLNSSYFSNDIYEMVTTRSEKMSDCKHTLSQAILNLIAEGGESFVTYLKRMGLSTEQNFMVLSSNRHYYYEENELKGIRTLVNLKKLNMVKHLDSFLNTLVSILPPNTNFIGCFSNNKKRSGNLSFLLSPSSRLLNRCVNFLDSRTVHFMNKNEVFNLLEKHGFNIVDMTEIKGLIYFYSQNASEAAKLRASLKASISKN